MSRKDEQQKLKKHAAHCWAVNLAIECHNRDNQTDNSGDGSYDGKIKQGTLSAVFADKTALIDERLTLIGYLEIMVILFKATFCNKKGKGVRKIFRGIIEEIPLGDES